MYYRLSVDLVEMNVYLEEQFEEPDSLIGGKPMPGATAVPLEYTMAVDKGLDDDLEYVDEPPLMYAFFPHVNLMSTRLVQTLTGAGVDNLQLFPARITDPNTGATYDDYFAVNVIGLVECADMDESDHAPLADLFFFHELVIKPEKTLGLPLFRLAESPIDIIVNERVAQTIRNANFPELVLEPVSPP